MCWAFSTSASGYLVKTGVSLGEVKEIIKIFFYFWVLLRPGPEVIKLFPCLTQLSTKFILLINVKMLTIVGISTFISMINTTSERLKAGNFLLILWPF